MEDLESRIDTNKRNGMEPKEVMDFLKSDKNVKELGEKLEKSWNMNTFDRNKNQKFFDAVNNATLNNTEFQNKIKEKIKSKKGLNDQEVFMLYLQSIIENNSLLGIKSAPITIKKEGDIYTRYGGQALLNYIRTKYNNQSYEFWKGWPNLMNSAGNDPKKNPSIIETQKRNVALPKSIDFGLFGESNTFSPKEFGKLDDWAKSNFSQEYEKEKKASQKRNSEKGDLMNDYVKFDLYNFAWQKYNQLVEEKHNGIIGKIYGNEATYKAQKKLAEQYYQEIDEVNEQYPDINKIMDSLKKYGNDLEASRKKYLKNTKEEVAQKKYEEYGEELNKRADELGIKEIQSSFSKELTSESDAKKYCEKMNKLFEFQSEQESIKNKYGNIIDNYEKYMTEKGNIVKKYGISEIKSRVNKYSEYNEKIKNIKNNNFNIKKYETYIQEINEADIEHHTENLNALQNCLNFKDTNSNFPIPSIKKNYEQQLKEQEAINRRRENLKKKSTFLYQLCHIGARGINALVQSTWGTGVKLGATISKLWHDDDEMVAVLERSGNWTPNIIGISEKQSESVYKDGQINFNWDNGPGVIAESIVNMITLIAGGGAIAKGIAKGGTKLGINLGTRGMNVIGKVGLFKSGFIQQIGNSFQEGFNHGMNGNQALVYGMLSAGIQGGLELVSPNEFLLGSGSKLAKAYVKEILKTGSKQNLKEIGKLFLKNVGSEIIEENIQESIQLAAGNLINDRANDRYQLPKNSKLEADWNVNNFYATAIVTTLTTGITAGGGFAMQTPGLGNQENRLKLLEGIKTNPKLQADVMNVLDNAITGKVKIPNIDIQKLKNLKNELSGKVNTSEGEIKIPAAKLEAPNEKFAETDESFREIVTKNQEKIKELNEIQDIDEFIRQSFEFIKGEMGIDDDGLSIRIIGKSDVDNKENNQYSVEENQITISRDWAGHTLKHIEGKGNKAEIFGCIVHELNHYLQTKEIILSNEGFRDACLIILDGGTPKISSKIQNESTGEIEEITKDMPEPMKNMVLNTYMKYNNNFDNEQYLKKAKVYEESYNNYIEPIKDKNNVVINYNEYKGQPVEEESFRRGDLVVEEYKKIIETNRGNESLETKNQIQEFINGKCESPIEGVDKIIPFEKLKNMLIESAQKNNLKDVAENIKNGNYEDPRIYGLPKYKELLEKGFILPSDIRPYYKSTKGLPEHHLGIDYQVKAGTEVKASYDGVVIKSHLDGGLGHKVIIEHTTEGGKKFYSLYGHLGKDNLIPEGTPVTKGTVIGKVGESFTEENGKWPSHLHFQIMENEDSPRGHASTEGVGNYNVLEAFGINYFNGKSHKFEVTDKQATDNSQYMDKLINEINEGNKKEKFNELKNRINTLYGKDLNLTNEQLSSILDAHKQDGKLGELKMNELRNKNTILAETIKDKDVRRFLLEAGFCGKTEGIMENIELLKTNAERLEELGIEVDPMNTDEINNMEIDLKKIEKLKNIGIKFNELFQYEIEEILKIEIDYEKLEYMINLGMEIKTDQIKELNDWEIDKETLLRMKNIGILNCFNREKINKSNIEVFEKLKNIGVEITYDDGNPLLNLIYQFKNLGLEDRDFQFIKENNLTNYTEIWFALSMKDNMNKETIKEYTKRKEIYLEKNRTITGKKYLELFGGSGKYGKTEINQMSIGLCYAYTGFEILKKTNSFDAIVQTNLKESSDGIGWEVRIPLCDKNGEWIKISKDEIDYKFERKNENGEISIVSINSESESIGFKILELAFIKKCIIDSIDWQDEWKCNMKGIDYNAIKKAQTEYKNTGKISYNDDLVKFVESGSTREFVKKMFNPKGNKYFIGGTQNPRLGVSEQAKDAAFENFNKGGILIEISIQHDNINDFTENNLNDECELIGEGEDYSVLVHDVKIIDKAQYNLECEYKLTSDGLKKIEENRKNNKIVPDLVIDENGKTICQIFKNHAYSIEKCYIDKNTGEKRVWVINPRHTGLKFDISLEEAKSIFSWNVFGTDIDAMFRDK